MNDMINIDGPLLGVSNGMVKSSLSYGKNAKGLADMLVECNGVQKTIARQKLSKRRKEKYYPITWGE
eukprot:9488599-Ditylum_brightwellii.AAC.1